MNPVRGGCLLLLLGASAACTEEVQVTRSHTLGGQVQGLSGTLVLANGVSLLPVTQSGAFVFPDAVPAGTQFAVQVHAQPGGQECVVHNGLDVMANQNVTGIVITCAQNLYKLGGRVIGLDGASGGVTLSNGNDKIVMNGAGDFVFPAGVAYNSASAVAVVQSPNDWSCSVSQPLAPVVQDTNAVEVSCVRSYSVGGAVTGTKDSLILINGGVLVTVPVGQTSYAFTGLVNGTAYGVGVVRPPSGQACTVSNPSGRVVGSNVSNVAVNCNDTTYNVSGTITGHADNTTLSNAGSQPQLLAHGANAFVVSNLKNGQSYNLVVTAVAGQACTLRGPSTGVIDSADVQGVVITCSNQNRYNVGGKVTGAQGDVTLVDTGSSPSSTRVVSLSDPNFSFQVYGGSRYSISVSTPPPGQLCRVSNATGQVSQSDISNLVVSCYSYSMSGYVTGDSNGLILKAWQNGALRRIPVAGGSTTFSFANFLPTDQYTFGVYASSPGNRCTASGNLSGTIQNSNVTGLQVTCQPRTYKIFATARGLQNGETLILRLHEHPEVRATANSYDNGGGGYNFDVTLAGVPNNAQATLEVDPNSILHGKNCGFYPNATFYIHNASLTTVVAYCGTNPPPSGTRVFTNQAPVFDFETSTQGWDQAYNASNTTASVVNGPLPTGPVYHGQGALEFAFTHSSDGAGCADIKVAPGVGAPSPPPGQPVEFASIYYWYPADMPARSTWAFMSDQQAYAYQNTDAINEPDTWIEGFFTMPANPSNIGVKMCVTADYTGSFFVDSVDYPLQ